MFYAVVATDYHIDGREMMETCLSPTEGVSAAAALPTGPGESGRWAGRNTQLKKYLRTLRHVSLSSPLFLALTWSGMRKIQVYACDIELQLKF